MKTIKACLKSIGVDDGALEGLASLPEEWAVIKKAYFKKVLKTHPDKGGDPDAFRAVQASFEVLRDLYDSAQVASFSGSSSGTVDTGDAFEVSC